MGEDNRVEAITIWDCEQCSHLAALICLIKSSLRVWKTNENQENAKNLMLSDRKRCAGQSAEVVDTYFKHRIV